MEIPKRLPTLEQYCSGVNRVHEDSSDEPKKGMKVTDTSPEDFLAYFKDESNFTSIISPKYTADEVIEMIGGEDKFLANYKAMRAKTMERGLPKREDMPVINADQVGKFAVDLVSGNIDIFKPYADKETQDTQGERFNAEEFPAVIRNRQEFLNKGKADGQDKDDKIEVSQVDVPVSKLKPSQDEIYGSKIAYNLLKYGPSAPGTRAFGGDVIVSQDGSGSESNRLLDGHHRWATAYVSSPDVKMGGIQIGLPLRPILLAVGRSYGNAMGNSQQA